MFYIIWYLTIEWFFSAFTIAVDSVHVIFLFLFLYYWTIYHAREPLIFWDSAGYGLYKHGEIIFNRPQYVFSWNHKIKSDFFFLLSLNSLAVMEDITKHAMQSFCIPVQQEELYTPYCTKQEASFFVFFSVWSAIIALPFSWRGNV